MEVYVEAGAYARLLSDIGPRAVVAMSKVLPAKEADRIMKLLYRFDEFRSKAEDQMFRDYPQIGDEGIDVFYGPLTREPVNELDGEVIRVAKAKADELFPYNDVVKDAEKKAE